VTILELCRELEGLGVSLEIRGDSKLWLVRLAASKRLNPTKGGMYHTRVVTLPRITKAHNWADLEALCGFVEAEVERLGKWERYSWQLGANRLPEDARSMPLALYTALAGRRPTPLEKLTAAVEALK